MNPLVSTLAMLGASLGWILYFGSAAMRSFANYRRLKRGE